MKRCARVLSISLSDTVYPRQFVVITDRLLPAGMGSLGLSRLSAWWVALGIDLERGRPGHPQDNAAHERMHGDISRELEAVGQSARRHWICGGKCLIMSGRTKSLEMRCPGGALRCFATQI